MATLSIVPASFKTFRRRQDYKRSCSLAIYLITRSLWTVSDGNLSHHLSWTTSIRTESCLNLRILLKGKSNSVLLCFRVNVSLANFIDMLIDYPYSKEYAYAMFDKLQEMSVMTADQNSRYKRHIRNLEAEDEGDY